VPQYHVAPLAGATRQEGAHIFVLYVIFTCTVYMIVVFDKFYGIKAARRAVGSEIAISMNISRFSARRQNLRLTALCLTRIFCRFLSS
jgi:hypothetical protein